VNRLTFDQIAQIYRRYSSGGDLGSAFKQRFGQPLDEDALNASHQIIIVAAGLDDSTERIIGYLNEREIPINVLFFQVFDHGADNLISRTWMIDPGETHSNAATVPTKRGDRGPWNGEFSASFGGDCTLDEARKFEFISAGGAVCTGLGEIVLRALASFVAVERLRTGATPQEAADEAIRRIARKNPNVADYQVGILVLDFA